MKLLRDRILKDGKCYPGGILKVDKFINHQMDPNLMKDGNAAKGIIDLCNQAGAELIGMGFIIEKAFQHGREVIEAAGIRCESLAIVDSLDNCEIKLRED